MKIRLPRNRSLASAAAAMAVVLACGTGAYHVFADAGLSDSVEVNITGPVPDGFSLNLTVYTPGAAVPPSMPIGVRSTVNLSAIRGTQLPNVESVKIVLGGDRDNANSQITGERQSVDATLTNDFGSSKDYFGVIDARNLDFEPSIPARGTAAGLTASDLVRTVVTIDGYYNGSARTVSGVDELAEFDLQVDILDAAGIDGDGNLIPDASTLASSSLILFGLNGDVTFVVSLDGPLFRGIGVAEFGTDFNTVNGPIRVDATVPTLATMQTLDSDLSVYDTARLIVTISNDPASTLDGPEGANPLGEFDLTDGSGMALPAPQNLFARTNIALATLGARGTVTPAWTFLDTLPASLTIDMTFSGPGIAALLQDATQVGMYTYDTTMQQDGETITALGDGTGWMEITDLFVQNNDNADDAADAARIVAATDGDDTILASSNNASAIWASNVTPKLGSAGSGDGGTCFIATAAYGTPLAREIGALRAVRDRYLLRNGAGTAFVDTYYRLSPGLADRVATHPALKNVVRMGLDPVLELSRLVLAAPGFALLIAVLGLVSCASGLGWMATKRRMRA